MFNNYRNTVLGMVDEIFKISVGGEGYVQTVLNTMLILAFTVLALLCTVGASVLPLLVYHLLTYKLKIELSGVESTLNGGSCGEDQNITNHEFMKEEFRLKKKEVGGKLRIRRIGFTTGMISLYIPVILPIILIVGDMVVGVGIPSAVYFGGLVAITTAILGYYSGKQRGKTATTAYGLFTAVAIMVTIYTVIYFLLNMLGALQG